MRTLKKNLSRKRKENLLREQEAKADAEALDAEYFSLGDIFVDPFTKGIKKDIPDFLQEGPLVDAASKLFGLAEEGLDNVTSGPLADKVRAGRDKFGEFIANNLVSGPAVDATSDQLRQFQENLTSGPAVDAVSDQLRQLEENLPVTGKAIHDYFYDSGAQLQEDLSGAYDTLYNLGAGTNELYNDILGIPGDIKDFMDYAEIFNQGGRVGLANGGLGYSYKNNIFSADPSTGIPAVVDNDDDGVANQTFINLFPGLFPPVTDPVETIIDTPAVPMGGGGGDGFKFSSNAYSANPDGTIGFQNPAYDGILGDEYKDRPIGDEFTLGTSPLSDYGDIFNPNEIGVPSKKKGFFDAYGKFVGSDDMPLGTLPGAQFQDFFTDDEGNFDFTKAIPFSTAFKTLDNFLSNVLGFKTDTDSDPEQYDKVKDPMKAFKDLETKTLDAMEKDLANQAAKDRTKIGPGAKVGSLGQGGGQDRSGGLSGSGSGAGKGGLGAGGQGGKNKGTARF